MTNSAFVLRSLIVAGTVLLAPLVATAQPSAGQVAAGGDIGIFLPKDDQLSTGWTGDGFVEFYATPRVGVRGIVTAIRNGYERFDNDDERQLKLGVDLIYNWEGGKFHPFVGAGFGIHFLRFYRDGDHEGPDDNNFGGNVLGGVEVFMNRAWTTKFEARYQFVKDRPNLDPDGLGLLVGLKRYF